jgi:hypothetical protein
MPGSIWMIVCGSCMLLLREAKSMSAGMLSRVWRVYSRPLGSSACWDSGSPFVMQGDCFTGSLPPTDIPSANVAVALAALPNQKQYDGKPDWARSGRATHWVSSFGCPSYCGQGSRLPDKEWVFSPGRITSGLIF